MIEELLYTGRNCEEAAIFTDLDCFESPCFCDGTEDWAVETPNGTVWVHPGDTIIRHTPYGGKEPTYSVRRAP